MIIKSLNFSPLSIHSDLILFLGIHIIPKISCYKYLGISFADFLSLKPIISNLISKLNMKPITNIPSKTYYYSWTKKSRTLKRKLKGLSKKKKKLKLTLTKNAAKRATTYNEYQNILINIFINSDITTFHQYHYLQNVTKNMRN
ncbi:hypothetical protein BCR32DRAFT_279608 [Anaeromyces robustus]|uniref:Uncharacterized protein n=1 Tax=Anaeromyces robustus TaxID=1754192 RepID=A0A1Y1X762_9FUNG|nr:hypothetical protein BCR32DRAFT_279608 [Anaeromyces robustus]|eukprot:ORX81610.1 hypothetical protein BCR32DRAFT_279608 [Anaeromyces robustus]